jgi:beta-ketodecanoyl-[acyl-carrier-protein] synthase
VKDCVISGTGLWVPPDRISNAELVASLTRATERWNEEHKAEIEAGALEPRDLPSERFIVKASGVESRYVIEKTGVLDPARMRPHLRTRAEDEPSIQCEISVAAIREALDQAGRRPEDVDAVLVACSNLQRPYPAVAIEVQDALGASGWAYDLNVACSSATFGLQTAADLVRAGHARAVLMCNPEICSGHLNFRDRDSHFIFGDVATAVVVEAADTCSVLGAFEIAGTRLKTRFSNNIRNNFGFLNRTAPNTRDAPDKLFVQEGRKVFKEVVPMVAELINGHLSELGISAADLKRLWLHQANLSMNELIARKVLGRDASPEEAPVILDEYANTSSAGSIIAFHKYNSDFTPGDVGVICSFGAGYSAGSVIVRKVA